MGLTEKTLELNVTHELLLLGQGISAVFWRNSPTRSPPRPGPPIYAAGLSLQEEAEYGWDVRIELPSASATPQHVFLLQFKLGEARIFSTYQGTRFARGAPDSGHVLFEFNNNRARNQHGRLKRTARALGMPQAAIYAFPLVTTLPEMRMHAGALLDRTAFVTAIAIDRQASPPVADGRARRIAISTSDPTLREVRSEPALVDEDVGGRLIGEIAAVRLHREMTAWRAVHAETPRSGAARGREGRRLVRSLARSLAYFLDEDPGRLMSLLGVRVRGGDDAPDVAATSSGPGPDERGRAGSDAPGRASRSGAGRDRLPQIASLLRPLTDPMRIGAWPARMPALPPPELLLPVDGVVDVVARPEEGDGPGATRIGYMVV